MWNGIANNGWLEGTMAGHTYDRRMYDHCIANNCADSEFPIQKRAADMDGEEHPCVAPLLRKADRPGVERVAAAYESASSGGARARPIGFPESFPLGERGRVSATPVGEGGADRVFPVFDRPKALSLC
jgi:hypothetical protein